MLAPTCEKNKKLLDYVKSVKSYCQKLLLRMWLGFIGATIAQGSDVVLDEAVGDGSCSCFVRFKDEA
jgi:hypothetical protein